LRDTVFERISVPAIVIRPVGGKGAVPRRRSLPIHRQSV